MHHQLAEQAFRQLYPDTHVRKELALRYSARFKDYNATITDRPGRIGSPGMITFSLSRKFQEASPEIQIGVMQHLLNKLKKTRIDTMEIQLYNTFIKKLADYVETNDVDSELKRRFDQLNHAHFDGYMLTPNLVWGTDSTTKLGHYEYATDTISISTVLQADPELLDYVLYHEMLHKKHKFSETKGGFTRSHTKAFQDEEKQFRMSDGSNPEKRLGAFLRQKKQPQRRSFFSFFR